MSHNMATILIVDDYQDVRMYLGSFLSDNGYQTVTADDGEAGLEAVKKNKPDLITLDIIMPNQTGVKMYRAVKDDDDLKDIPVIIVSGVTRYKELFRRSHKTMPKPEGFIEKPIDRGALLEKIKEVIG